MFKIITLEVARAIVANPKLQELSPNTRAHKLAGFCLRNQDKIEDDANLFFDNEIGKYLDEHYLAQQARRQSQEAK